MGTMKTSDGWECRLARIIDGGTGKKELRSVNASLTSLGFVICALWKHLKLSKGENRRTR